MLKIVIFSPFCHLDLFLLLLLSSFSVCSRLEYFGTTDDWGQIETFEEKSESSDFGELDYL